MSDGPRHNLTDARRQWLEPLLDGPVDRKLGRVGNDCRILGWTAWAYSDRNDGELLTADRAREKYGADADWFSQIAPIGECITIYGRQALGLGVWDN